MNGSTHWTRRGFVGAGFAGVAAAIVPRVARAATTLRWATVLPTSHPRVAMMEGIFRKATSTPLNKPRIPPTPSASSAAAQMGNAGW